MPFLAVIVPILMSAAAAEEPPIIVKAYPWAPFISPMGEPFRSPAPARTTDRALVRPGRPEPGRHADGRRNAGRCRPLLRQRSTVIRTARSIPRNCIAYEWEIAPEVQVNSQWKRPRQRVAAEPERSDKPERDAAAATISIDGYRLTACKAPPAMGLLNIPAAGCRAPTRTSTGPSRWTNSGRPRRTGSSCSTATAQGRLDACRSSKRDCPSRPKGPARQAPQERRRHANWHSAA